MKQMERFRTAGCSGEQSAAEPMPSGSAGRSILTMSIGLAVMLVWPGCRVGFDALTDGGAGFDAGPFGAPSPIAEISAPSIDDDDPSLTGDLLELYFNSDRAGGVGDVDIWRSTRASSSDPWRTPAVVGELSTEYQDSTPEVAADGLTIWFASNRPGGKGKYDIWFASRPNRSDPWSVPVAIPELNTPDNEGSPAVADSKRILVFYSDRSGGAGGRDLYISSRASENDPWNEPSPLAAINSPEHDSNPYLASGASLLFFDSGRPGGQGARDLYVASRPTISDSFDSPTPLAELNSESDEVDAWISADLRYLVFASDRSGRFQLYETRR